MVSAAEGEEDIVLMRAATVAACVLSMSVGTASAVEVLESDFQVTYLYGGVEQHFTEYTVPLLPANACYTWWIRVAEGTPPEAVVERLILPEPLADWGDLATNPDDGVEISADSAMVTSSFVPESTSEGWFSKGWCVAAGDPLGAHRIEVSIDDAPAVTFEFEVVAPEDYAWPSLRQPEPRERSVLDSW